MSGRASPPPTDEAQRGASFSYIEWRPARELASHARCVWAHAGGPSGRVHRVLPDGCTDIVWMGGERLVVAGPATRHVFADIPAHVTAVGVRFGPGTAGAALGLPARELRDRNLELAALWGRSASELAQRLAGAPADRRLGLLAGAVARRLREAPPPDTLVAHAARVLAGGVSVTETGREVALGERHLRRRFHDTVGYGPKTLQRILRLHRFLQAAETVDEPDLARIAAEAGYFDQPHLTRECGELTGLPPGALLAARKGSSRPGSSSSATRSASPSSTSMTS
jgi:AraC-like DNA-binding protein